MISITRSGIIKLCNIYKKFSHDVFGQTLKYTAQHFVYCKMNLATIDFLNFSDFYCFAFKICLHVIFSAFRSIAWVTSLNKLTSELT